MYNSLSLDFIDIKYWQIETYIQIVSIVVEASGGWIKVLELRAQIILEFQLRLAAHEGIEELLLLRLLLLLLAVGVGHAGGAAAAAQTAAGCAWRLW